ncbi:MAG: FkbM family methyltransferase [Oscillospiraceae bacterium]|nr:FkbM family methyltransferase [Oscillospiraceae bacterium]
MPLNIKETVNCWDFLKQTHLPIFIYGMGDGALKIMRVFEQYGIPPAGFFASDEFVRGHSFEGHLVHKLSEIEEAVDDFIVVLAFAAGYESLYDRIIEISKRHTLLAPDVPVAGDGLFTYEYYLENKDKFERVYDMLADEKSRQVYENVINFKISGKIHYLDECTTPKEEVYSQLVKIKKDSVYIDLGAYNGDTVLEFAETAGGYRHIYAFEPNRKNFRKLEKNTAHLENVTSFNAGAWNYSGSIRFTKNEGRMSHASASGEVETPCLAVDDGVKEQAQLIKLDVEGAEREAIIGAESQISGGADVICALYHRNEDMFAIPLQIHELSPKLKMYIRHQLYIPAWETNLYAVSEYV